MLVGEDGVKRSTYKSVAYGEGEWWRWSGRETGRVFFFFAGGWAEKSRDNYASRNRRFGEMERLPTIFCVGCYMLLHMVQ